MSNAAEYIFRRAEQADMPWLMSVYEKFYPLTGSVVPPSSDRFSSFLGAAIDVNALQVIVAESGGERVGAIGIAIMPSVFNSDHTVASELFFWVTEEHRCGGVGNQLLEHAEQVARESGATTMNMIALENSLPKQVRRMYLSRGYKPIERLYEKEL